MGDVVVVAFRGDVADARGAEGIICDCVGVIPLFVILSTMRPLERKLRPPQPVVLL